MSDPTRIGDIFPGIRPSLAAPEVDQPYLEAARISVANHIAGLLDAREEAMAIEDADPELRQRHATELTQELITLHAEQQQLKGNG